jgi:hypothetical protein
MSLENPTGVNAFNGLSDDAKGAAAFEGLWNAGAFNPDGKPDAAQGQQAPEPQRRQEAQAETPAAGEEPPDPAAVPAEPEAEGPEYQNLSEYLTKAGVQPDSFYQLPVEVKIDGQVKAVPLADVIKSYQLEGHVHNKSAALAEQQRTFEAERAQAIQLWGDQIKQAQALGNLAHQQLLAEFQGIDWNRLRTENPTQWAVLNTDFNNRAAQIQQHLQQMQLQEQQRTQMQQQEIAKTLPRERDKMLEARPEWRDEKQFQAARQDMSSYARKLGFTDAEISGVLDHRIMLALHDAARYAALQAQAPAALKRVRTAPQQAQGGARQARDPKEVARQQAKSAFQKNIRDPDAQARYFDTLV